MSVALEPLRPAPAFPVHVETVTSLRGGWARTVCRATTELHLAGYRLPTGLGDTDAPDLREQLRTRLSRLSEQLVQWLLNLGPEVGLELALHGEPLRHRLHVAVRLQLDGLDEEAAVGAAELRTRELRELLGCADVVRMRPVEPRAARLRCGRAALARPRRLGHLVVPARRVPLGAGQVDELVAALLAQQGPVTALLQLRPVDHEAVERLARPLVERLAHVQAEARGRAEGLRVASREGYLQRFPEDLVLVRTLDQQAGETLEWLDAVVRGALSVRVAAVGEVRPSDPLIHAVARAWIGAERVRWCALSAEQAAAVAGGPLAHLPLGEPEGEVAELLTAWTPAPVVGVAATLPTPERHGLPGLPLSGTRRRVAGGALVGRDGALLGEGWAGGRWHPLRLSDADLARHLYLSGKTGVGKSTVLQSLICELALAGQGVALVDPHGDLVEACRRRIGRRREVVVFDPADPTCPALDPLEHDGTLLGMERVVEDLTGVMFRLYPADYMGPAFDRHSRALLFPLLAAKRSLADIGRLHSDKPFRRRCLDALDRDCPLHEEAHRFWTLEYPDWGSQYRSEMQTYVLSKYEALVKSSALRRVCAPDRKQLDLHGLMDRGGVLLVKLSEGLIGQVSSWFLGMMLVGRLRDAVFSRSGQQVHERRPFTLVLDEFQHLVGGSGFGYTKDERTLAPLLSEARKFGLRLVLAHQFTSQLDEPTREAIFGNVGSFVCFRAGARDAGMLAHELGGGVGSRELQDLPLFHAVARLLCDGEPAPVATLRTIPPRRPRRVVVR